ncbi:uncharacterized protein CFP56_025988 [Quercus suber]|uniref:Uncharacterized protein n=1 Tax=Quercus suber TaxID=58331 RepID=A0AAW0LW63_QUESU
MKPVSFPSSYSGDGLSCFTKASSYKVIQMASSKKQQQPKEEQFNLPDPKTRQDIEIQRIVLQHIRGFMLSGFRANTSENYIKCQAESAVFKVMEGIPKEKVKHTEACYQLPQKEGAKGGPSRRYRTLSTNQGIETAVPVLLVDGYNVCGYWMKLKKHFMNGRLDIARQKLVDELITYSMLREVKVVVVFDAMMSGLPTHKENFVGVDIVYSGESCADAWIEKEVAALKEDGCPKVWVVTSDNKQQHAAHGAGAFVWSCKALVSEIKASQREVEMMLQEQRSTSFQGKLLKHNLDSEVVDALKDLRRKLSENESKTQNSRSAT